MMDCREMPKLAELNIPYYVQIYDIIYQLIQEEKLKEGDTLPGEEYPGRLLEGKPQYSADGSAQVGRRWIYL